MSNGAGSGAPNPRRRRFHRHSAGPPPRDQRSWVHPSELPNFDKIPVYDGRARPRRKAAIAVAMGLVVVGLAATILAHRGTTPTVTGRQDQIATSLVDLPSYARAAARSSIELVVAVDGHVTAAAAMVIAPGDLAVTTDPIPPNASIMGSSSSDSRFPVTYLSYNSDLGITIVRLSRVQPITPTASLPAGEAVLAIAPYFSPASVSPRIAYATTTLSDPVVVESNDVVSILATPSDSNLDGLVDALAVDPAGDVVAVLSGNDMWYSARYITRVAQVTTVNGGCHASIGVAYTTASDGGVQIVRVLQGPSRGVLEPGDILTSVDGTSLDSMYALQAYLYASPAPSALRFELLRSGRLTTAVVVTGCEP